MNARALAFVGLLALPACSSTPSTSDATAFGSASASAAPSGAATVAATATPVTEKKKVTVTRVEIADGTADQDAIEPTKANDDTPPPNWTGPGAPHTTNTTSTAANTPTEAKPHKVGAAQSTSGAGQMSRENIEAALGGSDFGQCVDASGTFSARLVVAPNGSVTEARVTKSDPDDPRVRDCLTEALRRLSFPASNAPVPLSFSLAIEPS